MELHLKINNKSSMKQKIQAIIDSIKASGSLTIELEAQLWALQDYQEESKKGIIASKSIESLRKSVVAFRVEIDKYIKSFSAVQKSRETSLAYTSLQRSKMWLGKSLGQLGSESPYKTSENPDVPTIEAQTDQSEEVIVIDLSQYENKEVAILKEFRRLIQVTVNEMEKPNPNQESVCQTKYFFYLCQSILALEEAKMWLGLELESVGLQLPREVKP
jgi:hypothetical protein